MFNNFIFRFKYFFYKIVLICFRFKSDPFDSVASHASLVRATQELSSLRKKTGKVGVDGHLEHQNATPTVQGYGFVATPSPAPGLCNNFVKESCS